MTASESTALKTKVDDQHQRFALEYFSGEHAGNAKRSYWKVYPHVKESTAEVQGHELINRPEVRAFLEQLHEEARAGALEEMQQWIDLAPEAQFVIMQTVRGVLRSRLCYDAACEVMSRAFGHPTSRVEHQVRNESHIARALLAISRRKHLEAGGA